jgi:hypothetical protein
MHLLERRVTFMVYGVFWSPIEGHTPSKPIACCPNPLTRDEVTEVMNELTPCLDPLYRGQGLALLSLSIKELQGEQRATVGE